MLSLILIGLVLIVVAVLLIARQPDSFRVERSLQVAAPVDVLFAQVNDLHNWEQWSPWAKRDPQMLKVYEGPPAGVGALYRWAGNKEVGEGSLSIVDSQAHEQIRFQLTFLRPFKANNDVLFRFIAEGADTRVSWSMSGRNTFISKAVHLVMDMDTLCGGDFERGLAQLKAVAEARP